MCTLQAGLVKNCRKCKSSVQKKTVHCVKNNKKSLPALKRKPILTNKNSLTESKHFFNR